MSFNSGSSMNEVDAKAQPYVYPAPLMSGSPGKPSASTAVSSTLESLWEADTKPPAVPAPPAPPQITEEQVRAREARARKEGREEALAFGMAEFEKKLAGEKQTLAAAIREFARERETYFQRVDGEVVGLSLAIARKILHREAQVDPLLLAGVVRVGLDNVATGTRVRLRVNPDQINTWRHFFGQQADLQSVPELVGDPTLGPGHCVLETELGTTDLTLESQMKEIEQGFFDLLAHRPQKDA
jgi:flagellar assembly protein FliH